MTINNGVSYYTEDDLNKEEIFTDCLTISTRGEYSGTVTYHDDKFCLANNILAMPMANYSKYSKLYIATLIQKLGYCGYSGYPRKETLKKDKILLPIRNNLIDFEYMEKFINILEEERLQILETYLQVNSLDNCQLTDAEQLALDKITNKDIKFKEFKLNDLFTSQTGDVDIQRKHLNGKGTTYINSGITNCGVIGKTDFPAKIFKPNTITVDMFGNSYYRDFEYKMATHAHVFSLTPKEKFNKQIGLYICAATDYFKKCYSFSDMCNWNKMKKNNIILPVTINNTIDYDFMETYIKAIEKKVIQKVITWKESEMKTLKTVS